MVKRPKQKQGKIIVLFYYTSPIKQTWVVLTFWANKSAFIGLAQSHILLGTYYASLGWLIEKEMAKMINSYLSMYAGRRKTQLMRSKSVVHAIKWTNALDCAYSTEKQGSYDV